MVPLGTMQEAAETLLATFLEAPGPPMASGLQSTPSVWLLQVQAHPVPLVRLLARLRLHHHRRHHHHHQARMRWRHLRPRLLSEQPLPGGVSRRPPLPK